MYSPIGIVSPILVSGFDYFDEKSFGKFSSFFINYSESVDNNEPNFSGISA